MLTFFDWGLTVLTRAGLAFATALILSLICGNPLINYLHHHQKKGQPIREDGPKSHLKTKKGTPTMGGLLILGTSLVSIILYANIRYHFVWVSIFILIMYGLTGFVDDYWKIKRQNSNAMTAQTKLFMQFLTALIAASIITAATPRGINTVLTVPYFHQFFLNLSWLYVPFAVVVMSGASNGVNLSDGLDGLATGLLIISFTFFAAVAYYCGLHTAVDHHMLFIPRCGEMTVVCASLLGSCFGFLYFNKPKAKVFMGDTGSLPLGAILGAVAIMTKHEIMLAFVGGVFVIETISVIIQVLYFKTTGKRFFKMAPIHHHFEQLGWSEKKVVFSFWTAALALAAIGSLIFI
ncbi:MAG: phospho-N-acetylmuramoyl-pentapeptide-transferase [Alphaproteobacteria bacterium]|nr:phospho-N-acetylmuramoyl-pentapeptide-transferase [Alphaproteobacteria bacterium]